ncbi:MAG: hypothetical protein R2727_12050 [Bacteroidales bacterium]
MKRREFIIKSAAAGAVAGAAYSFGGYNSLMAGTVPASEYDMVAIREEAPRQCSTRG